MVDKFSASVEENKHVHDNYFVDLDEGYIRAHIREDLDHADYSLSWSREVERSPEDILGELSGVAFYGEVERFEGKASDSVYRDFFDIDENRWGADFWNDFIDVQVPTYEKLISDTLIGLYSETTGWDKGEASEILGALQQELPDTL